MIGIWNSETGQFETFDNTLLWAALFRSGFQVNADLKTMEENLFRSYFIGNMEIKPGHYRFSYFEAQLLSSAGAPFQIGLKGTAGGYFSGRQWGSEQSISWTLSSYLTVSLDNIFSITAVGEQKYRPHVARFRINTALNRSLSIRGLIQYSRDLKRISSNLRLRFNPSEGVDVFIVYADFSDFKYFSNSVLCEADSIIRFRWETISSCNPSLSRSLIICIILRCCSIDSSKNPGILYA